MLSMTMSFSIFSTTAPEKKMLLESVLNNLGNDGRSSKLLLSRNQSVYRARLLYSSIGLASPWSGSLAGARA
jgi:hypothetical protein